MSLVAIFVDMDNNIFTWVALRFPSVLSFYIETVKKTAIKISGALVFFIPTNNLSVLLKKSLKLTVASAQWDGVPLQVPSVLQNDSKSRNIEFHAMFFH